jgi:hypothetical protein
MTEPITIRHSHQSDAEALRRLAELDGRRAPTGPTLLAYADDDLVAAVGVEDGRVVADPFRYTSDVVKTLTLRAAQHRDDGRVRPLRWLALGHRMGRWGFTG